MNRFEIQNAASLIKEYDVNLSMPRKPIEARFNSAKAELIRNLQRKIECAQALTLEQYAHEIGVKVLNAEVAV